MGKKAKTSRKGKKAWRANINTQDVEDFVEKSNKEAVSGGPLADAPSDSLFYVDKSRDLSARRKIEKRREKVLHSDSLLQRSPFIHPIVSSIQKKTKKKSEGVKKAKALVQDCQKDDATPKSGMVDIWEDNGEMNVKARKGKTSIIPAVEVEPPGCSFNPSYESHQESLACAVADEMQKVYRQELGPEPIPLSVPGEEVDEEEKYFLDADDGSDDEEDNANEDLVEGGNMDIENRACKTKRVTRVELNRRARRKEHLKVEAESRKVKKLASEIDGLPDILQEIAKEDEEKERRHLRRIVAKKERLKSRPPRLGRYKFEPPPAQVLLSEEITGSLRKLKGCCTLARDRFKSLEKRGLVIPSRKSGRK